MKNKYEFSKGTLAIVPNEGDTSLVLEDEDHYIVDQKPFQIMDESCRYFGSSYNGRKEGAKNILGADYKVPIVVEDSSNLIAFPTSSPLSDDCIWISLNRVQNIIKVDNYNTKVLFDNDIEIIVPCSFRSIENQLSRASRLDLILKNRKNSS
ncbi:MAG: competence protein ComK [Bacilli bacterium]|nr:competence protein ComK [Bacilli bacterium]